MADLSLRQVLDVEERIVTELWDHAGANGLLRPGGIDRLNGEVMFTLSPSGWALLAEVADRGT